MKSTDLDAIVASVPIDKTAARQMSGGIHWTPSVNLGRARAHMDAPRVRRVPIEGENLIGLRAGRLTVVGAYDDPAGSKSKGRKWQVRCDCGQYEVRKGRALKQLKNPDECCSQCEYLVQIKRHEHFRRFGKWPDSRP